MEEFIHEFAGFHGTPSRCHIRILDEADKPLVVMCSQVAEKPGTSVTNMAEYIALDVKKYLERDNFTLASAIARYLRTKKLSEMLSDLINGLKSEGKYSIFALESIKLALEYTEKHKQQKSRVSEFIWVEHYSVSVGLHPDGRYAVVSFDKESWQPNWSHGSIEAVVNYTGYTEKHFESPSESTKKT
jgi:hypothetical protein